VKNYSLSPTEGNAIEMFRTDSIGRNQDILRFINLLDAIDDCCAIALNGERGNGKTFFVKQTKLIMDYSNPHSDMADEARESVKTILADINYQCSEGYAAVYYDAWANDNDEDPILSLIYATIKSNQVDIRPENRKSLFDSATAIADVITGRNVSDFFIKAKGTDILETLRDGEDIRILVNNFINALVKERANQVVFFIDELDRCKPTYAVKLLERVKHYFDDNRVIFVFSVSLFQLQHTIKCYYGTDFDATRYLDKFFDLRISLPEINYDTYLSNRFSFLNSSYVYDTVCVQAIKHFRLSLRETERYIRLAKISAYKETHSAARISFSDDRAYYFTLMYIVPFMIGLSMVDMPAYKDFITGKGPGSLVEILVNSKDKLHKDWLLNINECFSEDERKKETDIIISLEERLEEIYYIIFTDMFVDGRREKHIGQMEFSNRTREEMNRVVSLLSLVADYDFK